MGTPNHDKTIPKWKFHGNIELNPVTGFQCTVCGKPAKANAVHCRNFSCNEWMLSYFPDENEAIPQAPSRPKVRLDKKDSILKLKIGKAPIDISSNNIELRVLQWNMDSWKSKKNDLKELVHEQNPHIICLQEIKNPKGAYLEKYIEDFEYYWSLREGRGGGVGVLVRKELYTVEKMENQQVGDCCEFVTLVLRNIKHHKIVRVSNVYIPPVTSLDISNDKQLEVIRSFLISRMIKQSEYHLIIGDFNAHDNHWFSRADSDPRGKLISQLMNEFNFVSLNTNKHTRKMNEKETSPDISMCSLKLAVSTKWTTLEQKSSDHLPILITTDIPKTIKSDVPKRIFRNYGNANWNCFRTMIEDCLDKYYGKEESLPMLKHLLNAIAKADSKSIPYGAFFVGEYRHPKKIRSSKYHKRNFKKSRDANEVNKEIEKADILEKREKWLQMISKMKTMPNLNAFLEFLRGRHCFNFGSGNSQSDNKAAEEKAQVFLEAQDTEITKNLSKNIENLLKKRRQNNLTFPNVTEADVVQIISEMKESTHIAPDGIAQIHLKNLPDNAITFLAKILTHSLKTNTIPDAWKKSYILVGSDRLDNDESISIISPIAKVMEKIVLKHAENLQDYNKPFQHGSKKLHSSTTAILEIMNKLYEGTKPQKTAPRFWSILVTLDLKSAFESVSQTELFKELNESTLDPVISSWIINYLHNRKFQIQLGCNSSKWHNSRGGLPRGSLLSSVLFNFYTKDLPTREFVTVVSYGDKLAFLAQALTFELCEILAQEYLVNSSNFLNERNISICVTKSASIFFKASSKEARPASINIKCGNTNVPYCKCINLFGIQIDFSLTMKPYTNYIVNKLACWNSLLEELLATNWGCSKEILLATFEALIKPVATFASPSWKHLILNKHLELINSAYLRLLHTCCGLNLGFPENHIYNETESLSYKHEITLMKEQFIISALKSASHPSNYLLRKSSVSTIPLKSAPLTYYEKTFKRRMKNWDVLNTQEAQKNNHTHFCPRTESKILKERAPKINSSEESLPRSVRVELARFRCGLSERIPKTSEASTCEKDHGAVAHYLECISETILVPMDLWTRPTLVSEVLGLEKE